MAGGRAVKLKNTLEHDIVTGALAPGTRLDETSLASRFDVSRTPVREALNQLASIGLVQIRPRRGAIVAEIGLRTLVEMFEVMAELEGMCGRLAARRMTEDERAALSRHHDATMAFVESGDSDGYYQANVAFHEAIYRGSHNTYLAERTLSLRNRLAPYRRVQLRNRNRPRESFGEHEAILDAIVRGQPDEADRLLQQHVAVQGGSFHDFVASLPEDVLKKAG